jgi:hypothetical protein
MTNSKEEKIPDFIKKRINDIKKQQGKDPSQSLMDKVDIWSLEPERVFPDSPELQKEFINAKNLELSKRKNL